MISASSSSLRISEFVLLPSPLFATDAVVWLCTSNIFFIISRRSATCPSMEDIRSSTVVLIWFISPSSRSSKASTFLAAIAPGFEKITPRETVGRKPYYWLLAGAMAFLSGKDREKKAD
ncbi:hypothetical protein M5K25_007585 [Dendrobium thyrsiflorum]|uniref:Uncharacterized protein n=1 Tax=Dendrobium thyrsiflorum TaxID=117978 RepID=A0ABD0VFN7_DENTH